MPSMQCSESPGRAWRFGSSLLLLGLLPHFGTAQQTVTRLSAEMRSLARTDAPVLVLRHVTLFDGKGSSAKPDQAIVIDRGRISAVGSDASVVTPSGATVLDETGKTLLPGLVGMHEHLFFPIVAGDLFYGLDLADSAPRMYLAAGVTTARTTGAIEPVTDLATKHAIDAGLQAGPDLDVTGPYLDGPGTEILSNQVITGPEDARETVNYWAKLGVTSFKAYTLISPESLRAAIAAAHAHGLKLTGHLCSIGFSEASEMGIDNVEHGLFTDTELDPAEKPGVCPQTYTWHDLYKTDVHGAMVQAIIHDLVAHHVAVTSTLAVFFNLQADQPSLESLAETRAA